MTEHMIEGVISAEVDAKHHKLVPKGKLGAETSAVPSKPVDVVWRLHGQGRFVGESRKPLAERLNDAYRDDVLGPEEKGLLDRAANQFGRRLSDEE